MFLSVQYQFIDMLGRMGVAQDTLCGGKTTFVYGHDPATGVLLQGATASAVEVNMSAYSFRGVVQETQLHVHAMVELADILSWDDSWVPDEEHMLLDSTRETVEQYNLWSSDVAESSLECADLSSTYVYLARLRESTNILTTQACSDLVDQCGVREVRMFCPVTCQCNTMYTGMYDRGGCGSACDHSIDTEINAVQSAMVGVGQDSGKCAMQGDVLWMHRFLAEFQSVLVRDDIINLTDSRYTWTESFLSFFSDKTYQEYFLNESVNVDLTQWLDTSVGNGVCDAVLYFDNLFNTDLCSSSNMLALSLGSLEGLCPMSCGLCDDTGEWSGTSLWVQELYDLQSDSRESGLFAYDLFTENILASRIECDSAKSNYGGFGNQKYFNFSSPVTQFAVFTTCNEETVWDTVIIILNETLDEVSMNDDYADCDFGHLTSSVEMEVAAGEVFFVAVEGYSLVVGGTFTLSVTCAALPVYTTKTTTTTTTTTTLTTTSSTAVTTHSTNAMTAPIPTSSPGTTFA